MPENLTPETNIAAEVSELERKHLELRQMTGEILATIRVNVLRGTLPKELGEWEERWHRRWINL